MEEIIDPTLDYFEQYRRKLKEKQSIAHEIEHANSILHRMKTKNNAINIELQAMRRIISVMIETGMDPVEAKLKFDSLEHFEHIWSGLPDMSEDSIINSSPVAAAIMATPSLSWTATSMASIYPTAVNIKSRSTGAI